MKDKNEKYRRKSLRLPEYDYSQNGAYFITICTHKRELLLESEKAKSMITTFWHKLPKKFSHIIIDKFVIMPNHIHGIMFIVGADLCVCPLL